MSVAADIAALQGLRRQLVEARGREAHYWPAHAAELARVRLMLPPAQARLLVRLLAARGGAVAWQDLAPAVRRARKAAPDRQDEQIVHTQVLRLRAALSLSGFEAAVSTARGQGYAVAPALGADIIRRLGVEPPPELSPSSPEQGTVS
jgi:DNA-binding response OmpR family regulator